MSHDVLHYGANNNLSNVEMSIPCSQSNLSTSTHTLRQWRKKDVLLGTTTTSSTNNNNQTPSPGSSHSAVAQQSTSPGRFNNQQPQGGTATDVQTSAQMLSQHIMGEQQQSGGQIARVAPHNHYPRGTGGGTAQPQSVAGDLSQQQQQLYVPGVGAPSQAFSSQSGAAAAVTAAAAAHAAVAAAARAHQHHQYSHQYGHHPVAADYSYTPYKDPTAAIQHLQIQQHQPQQPTPVKYSEIVEPPPQSHHATLKPHTNSGNTKDHLLAASTKEYHQQQLQAQVQDMCNSMQGQSQQMIANQQVQQQYNPMKHHQYHLPQPHHLTSYYKHSPVPQYHHPQRYPSEANNYLADLNKIAPQMAQSIINDPHLRDPTQMYPSQAAFEPQRGSTYPPPNFQQQQQRLYGRSPGNTPNLYHQKPTGLYPSGHLPRGYQVKPQSSTDPYRNMHLYQSPTAKYAPLPPVPQQDYTKQLHLLDFNRGSYPENIHQLNYALPSKISPTSYSQCAQQQYEYSHHYQNRHQSVTAAAMAVPPNYHQMSMKNAEYLHHEQQQLHMPDLVRDNTPKSSNSLKQYLESWNDEDLGGANDEAGSGTLDLVEKPLIKITRPNENIYVLDSTDIPTETVSQYLQHVPQIDKLPDNIKFYPEINKISDKYHQPYSTNSMEGILNLTSSSIKPSTTPDYSPPACLRAEEPLNIRSVLEEHQQIASPKPTVFLSLPVIEEEIQAPIRSNRVEEPVLASTRSINEDSVVVPSPRNNCAVSPVIGQLKSSPELNFEAISGSVIVPNIAATQKVEVAPKIDGREELNFSAEANAKDLPLCYRAKDSEVVPKNDNLSFSVNSVDGDTLDLSVSDISAVVEKSADDNDIVVPDIQEDSVIHLASQKDMEVSDSDSAINLSHHGNVDKEDKREQIVDSTKEDAKEFEKERNIDRETKEAEQKNITRHENDKFLESTSKVVSIKMEPSKEVEGSDILLGQQEDSPQHDDINENFAVRGDHLKEEASSELDDILKDNSDRIEGEIERDQDTQMKDESTDDAVIAEDIKSVEVKPLEKSNSEEEIDGDSRVEKLDVSIESEDKLTVSTTKDDSINNEVPQESTLYKEDSKTMIEEDEESISKVNSPLQQENKFEETEFIDLSIGNKAKTKISSSDEDKSIINNSEETVNENIKNEDLLQIVDKDVPPESKEIDEEKAEIVDNAEAEVGEIAIELKEISNKNVEDLEDEKQHEVVPIALKDDVEETENNEEVQFDRPESINVDKSENDEEEASTDKNNCAIVNDLEHIASNSNIVTHSSDTSNISSEPTKSIENIEEPNVPCLKEPTEEIVEAINAVPPEENVLGQEEPIHHQEDNELNEGLDILRILQNNVILQIADELIQINVINTNDRKIISVIALSDCTVVIENNNNQEQVNVEEMQVVGIEENLPQEERVQENVQVHEDIADSDRKIDKLVEDVTPIIKVDTNSEENLQEKIDDENLTPIKANENVPLNEEVDENICGTAKNDSIGQDDEPRSIEQISNEINPPVDEDTRETPQDSVLNNLETMLEADMAPVIDFTEEENIQNEVIIDPEESQESISEEILLMDCSRNEKPEQEVTEVVDDQEIEKDVDENCFDKNILDNEKPILDISEVSAAKETKQKMVEDSADDKINYSEDVDVIKENAHLENDALPENLVQDNKNKVNSNDENSTVNVLETPALKMEDEESNIADNNEKNSTEEVDKIKLNIVEEKPEKEALEGMKDLPKACVNNLEDQEIPEVKLEIEKSIANEVISKDIVCEKESKKEVDELENKLSVLTSTKECKKFISKAALKLVEDNLVELKKKSAADELKQSEESDKEKGRILVEEIRIFKSSAKKSLKILINPIKRKLNKSIQQEDQIHEDSLSKNEENPDAKIIEEDHQDCPPKRSLESQSKTPDRTKIPGIDKLKTKFIIPKKSTSSTNSSSPTQHKTIAKKAKLVSFSAIVDEIKDRAEAARDKKMPSSNLTAILKRTATVVKKPVNKNRETRSLSDSQPKKLEVNNRRHSIASETKEIANSKKIIQSKTGLEKTSSIENVPESTKDKKNVDKKNNITPKGIEESIPKKSSSHKPLESIIARIRKEAKSAVPTKSTSPISKPTLVQKKGNKNSLLETPKSSHQEASNIILPPNKINTTNNNSDIKGASIETPNATSNKDPKLIESPKSEPDLIFKKENNSPKKYTKVKVFKSRMNSFDTDLMSTSQKSSEVKVKTKAELKEAIHLDIRDEPIMHIESIISEKINQEHKEKFLNASPPTAKTETVNSIKPLSVLIANESKPKEVEDADKSFRERKNSLTPTLLSDKEDDNTRKRLSLKEYNSRKRKISSCADSPVSIIDNSSMNSIDSPLQNLNPEPPEDDLLPPPIKVPSIDAPESITFVSRIETSPKAEDMNLAAPSTIITTPMSTSSSTMDDNIFMETVELQLAKNSRSIEDDKEFIAKKLEDLLVSIPIGQKSDKLMNRFFNRELLSTEEMQRVQEIIKHKKAKEEFFKKQPSNNEETNSITLGLGIKPLESYKKLNFDIASDIFIPIQMNDCKPFGNTPKVPKLSNKIDNLSTRSLGSYKKLNFDIASDISIPYGTNAPLKVPKNTPTKVLTVPEEKTKSQLIDSEPVFKRLQAELLNTSKSALKKPSTVIGINKTSFDKLCKPTKINRPIDNTTKTSVNRSIKPSFLSSTTSDGKDIIKDNGDSVYEISSSSESTANNRGHTSPTDDLKIHLRKVQPSPTELTPTRKRKKKRFRNLYSADTESSDETSASTNNSPLPVKSAASTEEEDKQNGAYSVICSGTVMGLPKIIIKRTNSDSSNMSSSKVNSFAVVQEETDDLGMQPVVRLMRNPRLDNLAKRKRKG